MISISDSCN